MGIRAHTRIYIYTHLYDHPSGDKKVGGEGKPTDDNCDDFDGDDTGVALARRWRCDGAPDGGLVRFPRTSQANRARVSQVRASRDRDSESVSSENGHSTLRTAS